MELGYDPAYLKTEEFKQKAAELKQQFLAELRAKNSIQMVVVARGKGKKASTANA